MDGHDGELRSSMDTINKTMLAVLCTPPNSFEQEKVNPTRKKLFATRFIQELVRTNNFEIDDYVGTVCNEFNGWSE